MVSSVQLQLLKRNFYHQVYPDKISVLWWSLNKRLLFKEIFIEYTTENDLGIDFPMFENESFRGLFPTRKNCKK